MRKHGFVVLAVLVLVCGITGCTRTIKKYGIQTQKYPEWMLGFETGRNYLGLQYGEHRKDRYEFDQNDFFIQNMAFAGRRKYSDLQLLVNPAIYFGYIHIIEVSYVNDNKKIYLVQNKTVKNNLSRKFADLELTKIHYKDFPKYFKNMEAGEEATITITYVYRFDDGELITREAPYTLTCFETEYSPLDPLEAYNIFNQ